MAKHRDRAFEMMDEGLIDARAMAEACLRYMSEDDCEDMLHCEGFDWAEEEDAEGEEEEEPAP